MGCANYKAHYGSDQSSELEILPSPTEYSSFFVGDLGYEPARGVVTLTSIQEEMARTDNKKSLLLLGDITGKQGFEKDNVNSKKQMDGFIEVLEKVKGKVFYTPGENELGRRGYFSRLDDLEDYFDDHCDKKVKFMPNKACSGPDDDEIFEGIGLIGLNTAWYMADWNNEAEVSEGCDFNDRHDFLFAAADEIKGYRDKVKIVMMHHPLESSGNRGGSYSATEHLFPLADVVPNLYLPLPIVGSLARALQSAGGGRHDLTSLRYKDFIRQMIARTEDEDNIIFISGHEHNLHYGAHGNYHSVTAGTGSLRGPAIGTSGADFVQGEIGYGRLDFLKNGNVFLRFFTVGPGGEVNETFRHKIIENRFEAAKADLPPVLDEPITSKTVKTPVYAIDNQGKSGLFNSIFGRHYRDLYNIEVEVPVLYIDTIHGGLNPYRRGGGQTTQSLHTRAGNGRLYQLRSVRKNPAQLLPNVLEQTFAADLARDQFTALHPYAPLTLPRMQRELGLLGADPGMYFVPKQPGLGSYNSSFGGEMYYLEQRPDEDWSSTGMYANSKNIISNSDMREEVLDDWKHRPDQKNFLLARLFDFFIGDWDRHRDQWRWAEIDQPDGFKTYLPVARDRDQVYSNFDGGLLNVAGMMVADARKLQPFDYEMGKARWRAVNGKWNDRFFLNEMTREDYEEVAKFLQEKLTDEVIDEAMLAFPTEIREYSLEKEDIDGKLKKRREQMLDFAMDYYEHLAEVVTVNATNKDDVLRATALENGDLLVQLFDADKDGEADEKFYERTFHYPETREVRLYGMDGDDRFELLGERNSKIRLRLIGGTDGDEVDAQGKLAAKVYDGRDGMELKGNKGKIKDRRSDRFPIMNQYQFQSYKPDYTVPFPTFGFNVDDGLFFGLGLTIRRHGFRPEPFAINHFIGGSISTNGTIRADYKGQYNNTFGRHKDLLFDVLYRSPDYVVNFFGLGNDTDELDIDNREFNRTRQERRSISPGLRLRGRNNQTFFTIKPFYESFQVDRETAEEEQSLISTGIVPDRVFDRQEFAGIKAAFHLNNLAYPLIPDNGLKLDIKLEQNFSLNDADRSYFRYGGAFTYYQFFGNQWLGLASRIGYERIEGEFEFYQAAQLGGRTNFRAVRSERFLGNSAFYHNTDIRIKGFSFNKKAASATAGFLIGADYGRVWLEDDSGEGVDDGDTWHVAYGGGLWFTPANAVVIRATYFTSSDGSRIDVGAGYPF
ncbi:hypothetical protein CEQ90_10505 [Lewinellaceae bacterium SD302]|nr:hypothetical protein CEQ90_10505 [Lewinellaceae bacterium SD302]